MQSVSKWDGKKVYDAWTGQYLGRAVGEPQDDGVEGIIVLRQDLDGQIIIPWAVCGLVTMEKGDEDA